MICLFYRLLIKKHNPSVTFMYNQWLPVRLYHNGFYSL